jgi:branched-chain amino acid transport system ATP-binding protein
MIGGFYTPDTGNIVLGREMAGRPTHEIARDGIARTYQTTQLFEQISVLDNILIALRGGRLGWLLGPAGTADDRATAEALLGFVGYTGPVARLAGNLPHVDRRLVEIARSLATRPAVLLLDEPAAGLTRDDKARLSELLRNIAGVGIAVILVEHDMSLVMSISDQVVVLDAGKLLTAGPPATVQRDEDVRRAYLGATDFEARPRTRTYEGGEVAVLTTLGLTAGYGAAPAVDGIDLIVNPGEMVAVLGANGAGKSTTMRAIAGLHRPVGGSVILDDTEIREQPAYKVVGAGLSLVPEGRQVFPELSARDNVRLGSFPRGSATDAELDALLDRFPRLRERIDHPAGLLSGGEQQMLAIARGLIANPRIILLDEPSLGLAPAMIGELYDILAGLRDEGMTILIVDQMANLALAVADRGYVLEGGVVAHAGPADDLKKDAAIEQAYLGDMSEAAQ